MHLFSNLACTKTNSVNIYYNMLCLSVCSTLSWKLLIWLGWNFTCALVIIRSRELNKMVPVTCCMPNYAEISIIMCKIWIFLFFTCLWLHIHESANLRVRLFFRIASLGEKYSVDANFVMDNSVRTVEPPLLEWMYGNLYRPMN